jgi:hypothetical protein
MIPAIRPDQTTFVVLSEREKVEIGSVPRDIQFLIENGSVNGALDNSIFAMVAFYEWQNFDWKETKQRVVEWIEESGTWDRADFAESSPEQAVENKKHVHVNGYGWKNKAEAARKTIESRL